MSTVAITYTTAAGVYDFSVTGRTEFARKVDLDPAAEAGKPLREVVTWSIKQEFAEHAFADNQQRYADLLEALRTPEGTLSMVDERGTEIFQGLVRVASHDLPAQWGTYLTEVMVQFRGIQTVLELSPYHAIFTPAGGSPITLPNVSSVRDGARTERPATYVDLRRETMFSFNLAGKVQADMTQDEATRRAALQAAKASIVSIRNCANGTLAFAGESHVVRVEQVEAVLSDLAEQLEWSVACNYRVFPDGVDVQVEYEVSARDARDRSETVTAVQGRVTAKTRGAAETRAAEILAQYTTGGAVLLDDEIKVALLDGADGADGWVALSFHYTYRTPLDVVSWDLTVATRDDLKSADQVITYSGRVTAKTAAAALAKARAIGDGKYPLRVTASETINSRSVAGSAEIFLECAFSYEYQAKGDQVYAEVSSKTMLDTFGSSSETISGFVAAAARSTATATALGFRLGGRLLRSQDLTARDLQVTGGAGQHIRVDFTFVYHTGHVDSAMQYTLAVENDYESRNSTAGYSGTVWAADEGTCDGLIDALVVGETGDILRDSRTRSTDQAQDISAFICKHFTLSFSRPLTARNGEDILEASVTSDITYSISMPVFTAIPGGSPFREADVYQTPAEISVNGRVAALTEASARAWAAGKRTLIAAGSFDELVPRMGVETKYKRKSGTAVLYFVASFQFSGKKSTLFLT